MTEPRTNLLLCDPLAEALFPVLIHRLNNATQVLSALNAALGAGLDDALLGGSSENLAAASRDVHELGWLLGVLASAGGADLLLERRTLERGALRGDGLRWMLDRHISGAANLGHALYLVAALETYWRYLESTD